MDKARNLWQRMRNSLHDFCDVFESITAVFVLVAIVVACVSLYGPFLDFLENRFAYGSFLTFVGYILNILIGIEFLKMLCHPSSDTVLEVLTFLVARHMIIEHTTVVENFISILSIGALFAFKKYLNLPSNKGGTDIFVSEYDWDKLEEGRRKRKEKRKQLISERAERSKKNTEHENTLI